MRKNGEPLVDLAQNDVNVEQDIEMTRRWMMIAVIFVGLLGLSGCMTPPETVYYWGNYQAQVYDYLQHADTANVAKQIQVLEKDYQKAIAANKPLAPGYHAHLGMLYYAQGQVEKSAEQFELEKAEFPESEIFIDRMLAKFKQ